MEERHPRDAGYIVGYCVTFKCEGRRPYHLKQGGRRLYFSHGGITLFPTEGMAQAAIEASIVYGPIEGGFPGEYSIRKIRMGYAPTLVEETA